ncbi:zinc finger protein DZIP1 isoform X2 [Manduca sexta]|uniref:zinc finger protein DZIP1 isoform X2 n=1 Tax=Manduca sexta TaxID=7130 RepID=UPI00188E228D|nr:zinc finger protein DZIP1 isoform X2 [Manduca sexta]
MACKTSYELHHNFPKLADESGFTFSSHRPRVHIDWKKIKLIDIERLIRERTFSVIEQHINDILDCVLESEFDVRILDDGVIKMFRLAQLAVEYQQFCRHYLDRSVYVLRQEISNVAQELDVTKKNLRDKEEELRKLRKRTRHTYKTPLPYGNDNIAAVILKTLNNRGDLFATSSRGDLDQYNKCAFCDKVFLNQLYLQSHIVRRHPDQNYLPDKETNNKTRVNENNNENNKLNTEIIELKHKLEEMQVLIANTNKQDKSPVHKNNIDNNSNPNKVGFKHMKDAEVSTNNEDYLLNKIEEWKKEEHEKCYKEINTLRNQIMDTINSFRQKEAHPEEKDLSTLNQLRTTILEQGAEILALKQELKKSENETEIKYSERIKEAEDQISFWTKRTEAQSKQYDSLLQKLNDVTKDAKELRELAEKERKRAEQLETLLLENNRNNKSSERTASPSSPSQPPKNDSVEKNTPNQFLNKQSPSKSNKLTDRETLENLHRKAQELLRMSSLSSSLSDSSSIEKAKVISKESNEVTEMSKKKPKMVNYVRSNSNKEENHNNLQNPTKTKNFEIPKPKDRKINKKKSKTYMNGALKESSLAIGSPVKIIRAKIAEDVHSRMVSLGVDPLKSRLPQTVYQSQRVYLQKRQEHKAKLNPSHEKIRHSIIAYLDSKTMNGQDNILSTNKYNTQENMPKRFQNLRSMISGVKTKAISLMKVNDLNVKNKRKTFGAEVAKRAISLLKTPPGSAPNSPRKENPSSKGDKNPIDDLPQNFSNEVNTDLITVKNIKTAKRITKSATISKSNSSESLESEQKYFNTTKSQKSIRGIDNLIKSPARRPSSTNSDYDRISINHTKPNNDVLTRTQSALDLCSTKVDTMLRTKGSETDNCESSDEVKSPSDIQPNPKSNEDAFTKRTKGVLKNASSTSSLNKKKVIFDMDAIQMKSLSATPSQSITEKSQNENFELGLTNLDTEEWDLSSIENEPLKNDTKLKRTSPKIAELKQTIESQLVRRTETSAGLVGRVDVLGLNKLITNDYNIGGSNTSLGSSILDESDSIPAVNKKSFAVPKKASEKENSELDISEFSIDGIHINKNESF